MKYLKLPISIESQIELLKFRGLVFESEIYAKEILSNISYYRLRAYTFAFQDNNVDNHPFNVEVTFEEIIKLYEFDSKLRQIIFEAIEKIEIALRTQIIYNFSLSYGSHFQLNPELYRDTMRFANHLDSLQKEIDRSNETFIAHYKIKYSYPTEPPSWMSLEVSSLGLLSKIFHNLKKSPEKSKIAKHFGMKDLSVIENWILCFSTLRNICAHHGRVWNRRLIPIKLPSNPIHPFLKNKSIYPNKLYASLSCMVYILKQINNDTKFVSSFKGLMKTCPLAQFKEMGFPENWEDEDIWR